jgi:hypothetical protein
MVIVRQGEQGWFLCGAKGNHEFARLFYFDDGKVHNGKEGPRYFIGQGGVNRLGPSELLAADLDNEGLTMTWSCGRVSHLPRTWLQVTYRV